MKSQRHPELQWKLGMCLGGAVVVTKKTAREKLAFGSLRFHGWGSGRLGNLRLRGGSVKHKQEGSSSMNKIMGMSAKLGVKVMCRREHSLELARSGRKLWAKFKCCLWSCQFTST